MGARASREKRRHDRDEFGGEEGSLMAWVALVDRRGLVMGWWVR